jgi:flagellar biosynthesis protein
MSDQRDTERAARLRQRDGATPDGDGAPALEVAALRYDGTEDHAPKMVAHGRGHAAQKILEIAQQHDVAVTKDPTLVSILGALDIGAEIPPDLYGVIAEVLAWAYKTDKQAGEQRRSLERRAA